MMGLSLSHIFTVSLYSDMVIARSVENQRIGGGKRGKVKGFSAAARLRLFRTIHQMTFESITFVTLTYPKDWSKNGRDWKRNLTAFKRVIDRKYGKIRAVWKMEYQRRGAPHFHIMMLDAPYLDIKALGNAWGDIVGSGDYNHYRNGVDIKGVRGKDGQRRVMGYLAKYVGKDQVEEKDHGNFGQGRNWGQWNWRKEDPVILETDHRGALDVVCVALTNRGNNGTWFPDDYGRCTIFGNSVGSSDYRKRILSELLGSSEKYSTRNT